MGESRRPKPISRVAKSLGFTTGRAIQAFASLTVLPFNALSVFAHGALIVEAPVFLWSIDLSSWASKSRRKCIAFPRSISLFPEHIARGRLANPAKERARIGPETVTFLPVNMYKVATSVGKGVPRKSTFVAKAVGRRFAWMGSAWGTSSPGSEGISVASSVAFVCGSSAVPHSIAASSSFHGFANEGIQKAVASLRSNLFCIHWATPSSLRFALIFR